MYHGRRGVTRRKDFHAASRELADLRFRAENDGALPDGIDRLSMRTSSLGRTALSRQGDTSKGRLEAAATRDNHLADLRTDGELMWPPVAAEREEDLEAFDPYVAADASVLRDHFRSRGVTRIAVDPSNSESQATILGLHDGLGPYVNDFHWTVEPVEDHPTFYVTLTPRSPHVT